MAKLMLVEDDNNLREIYEARLQAEGYQIVSAKDGEEALVLAKAEKPDLIIADIMMPKISGFEMLDILRNTDGLKEVKVIMLTALGQSDDQQRANRLGADRYLVKSQVTLEDIVKVSHELLGDQATPAAAAAGSEAPPAAAAAPTTLATPVTPVAPVTPEPMVPPPAQPALSPAPTPAPEPAAPPADPQPEPTVSVVPAGAPPPEPVAEPAAEPPSTTPAVVDEPAIDAAVGAQSAVQEEADVESRVEDFVAGASEEPTLPTPQPTTDSLTVESPDVTTAPAATPVAVDVKPAETTTAADDDKLIADAAAVLANSPESPETKSASSSTEPTAADTSPDAAKPKTDQSTDTRTKRVIEPLDTKPEKDLDTLLALEEAKTAKSTVPPTPKAIVANDNPKAPHAMAPRNPVIEPPAAEPSSMEPEDIPSGSVSGAPAPVSQPQPQANDSNDPSSIAL